MHEVDVAVETCELTCQRCAAVWRRSYDVHRMTGLDGLEMVSYADEGGPCVAPGSGSCPGCGGFRLKVAPAHDIAHRRDSSAVLPQTRGATGS